MPPSLYGRISTTQLKATPVIRSGAVHASQKNRLANSSRDSLLGQKPQWPLELQVGSPPGDLLHSLSALQHYAQSPFPASLTDVPPPPPTNCCKDSLLDKRPRYLPEVHPRIQTEILCLTRGQTSHQKSKSQDQKMKEETETKGENTHPTKTNLEIKT